jgi:hypothetical protein
VVPTSLCFLEIPCFINLHLFSNGSIIHTQINVRAFLESSKYIQEGEIDLGHCCEHRELSKLRPEIKDIISQGLDSHLATPLPLGRTSKPSCGLVPLQINGDSAADEVVFCRPDIFFSKSSSSPTTYNTATTTSTASRTPLAGANTRQELVGARSKTHIQKEKIRPSKAAGVNYDALGSTQSTWPQ